MISFYWAEEKKYPPYKGYCPEHGTWENWINDICVYEDWERNRRGKQDKPKQDKMLAYLIASRQPYQMSFL